MDINSKELNEVISVEAEKVNQISLLADEQRAIINESLKWTVIPYMPISKPFIQTYILNNMEYPLLESKLSQAAIEMRSKLGSLVDTQYQFQKTSIEIERLEIEKEEIQKQDDISERRKSVEVADKDLEIKIRRFRLSGYKSSMDSTFNEFKNWAETVKECIDVIKSDSIEANKKDPSVPVISEFTDINFDLIRTVEMKIKTQRWLAMEEAGHELTNSQKIFTENAKIEKQIKLLQDKLLSAPSVIKLQDKSEQELAELRKVSE